jgi:hypothetical protein
MKWCIICESGMVLLMELSKTDLDFIKSVHDGFQTTHRTAQVKLFDDLPRPTEPLS